MIRMMRWSHENPTGSRCGRRSESGPKRGQTFRIAFACLLTLIAGIRPAIGQEVQSDGDTGPAESAVEPTPVSPAQDRTDEEIRGDLQAVFDRVPAFSGLSATVTAGVVTLAGEVPDNDAADRALELARSQTGVVYVDESQVTSLAAVARLENLSSRVGEQLGELRETLPLLAVAVLIVFLFGVLAWLAGLVPLGRTVSGRSPFLGAMIQRVIQFSLVVAGLVLALEFLDATALVGAVVGTAGLAGLALGFAFKDIAENYLAGIILSLRNPFAKSDLIVVGQHEGKVVRLAGRETILMTVEGNHVQIPNATVFRQPVVNYTRNPLRRFTVEIGVASSTVLSEALDTGLEVLKDMKGVIDDPGPQALVRGFGDSTINLQFWGWVDQRQNDYLRVRSEAIRLLKVGLESAGIELPEPEYRVHLPDVRALPDLRELAGREERPPKPVATEGRTKEEGAQRDVSVDRTLDDQIEAERRDAPDEDLLEESEDQPPGPGGDSPNSDASSGSRS